MLLLVGLALVSSGCTGVLTRWIAVAPNAGESFRAEEDPPPPVGSGEGSAHRVDVDSPPASSSAWVLEPPINGPARGTILFLHGIRADRSQLLDLAQWTVSDGYRAVLVDIRGHGRSTGDWLTYGVVESQDSSRMIDELERRGVVSGPYGVFGFSYGAAVSILLAARDRRIAAVLAVASFCDMRTVIMDYADRYSLGFLVPDSVVVEAIDEAGKLGSFDPDEASPVDAVRRFEAPVLLVHGSDDGQIPPRHSEAIRDAAPGHATLLVLEGEGHLSILESPVLRESSRAFFLRHLAGPPRDASK